MTGVQTCALPIWGGWSQSDVATLETRVDLASDEEVTVYHWFNDGWNYGEEGGHDVLNGHVVTVTHYAADGTEIDSEAVTLPGGGAEDFFGDHRNFYSVIIKATRTEAGEYLIVMNEGGNIGYKGTAVSLEEPAMDYGVFNEYDIMEDGWTDTGDFMGFVNVISYPWVYVQNLGKYVYATDASWFYVPK